MMDLLRDKKFIIGSLLSVAIVFTVLLVTGYVSLPFYQVDRGDNLGCFVMLPAPECYGGRMITYIGQDAVGFNLPAGTEIYAPYDGVFFEDTIIYQDEIDTIETDRPIRARFGIPDTSTFVVFVGEHAPILESATSVTEGQHVANVSVLAPDQIIHEDSNSNFVVYAVDYDLTNLFK